MTLGRIARLSLLTTIASVSLVACASGDNEASTESIDRQAGGLLLGSEVCISREANAGPMTVTFRNSANAQGNGPFNLDYVQCGESPDSLAPVTLFLDIADSSGTDVLEIGARNAEYGFPGLGVGSVLTGDADNHSFSVGESYTYNVGPYSVEVKRQEDTATAKSFRVWVSKP